MALPPNLPPQAYTRDTLVKAIEWLTTQPAAVRERANSADLIVSHYLAARRRSPSAPSTDFRTLADDLRQFEEPAPESVPMAVPEPPGLRTRRREPPRPADLEAPRAVEPESPAEVPVASAANEVGHARGEREGANVLSWVVDARSATIAREVQDRMNLSSESEALRMLVAMGAERLRSVLP